MVASAPGANSRGRGGKFKKYSRGGGKQFSRDLQPVDTHGNAVSMWSEEANKQSSDEDDDDEEESGSEEEASRGPSSSSAAPAEASREDRKALKKARKEAAVARAAAHKVEVGDLPSDEDSEDDDEDDEDDGKSKNKNKNDMLANPNHSAAARKQTSVATPRSDGVDEITEGVRKLPGNRKEREAAEAAAAKARYMKLHAEGKTDTAKADLARLKLIREQREAEAARRQAEKEEKDEQEAKRRAEMEAREAKRREAAAGPKVGGKKKK